MSHFHTQVETLNRLDILVYYMNVFILVGCLSLFTVVLPIVPTIVRSYTEPSAVFARIFQSMIVSFFGLNIVYISISQTMLSNSLYRFPSYILGSILVSITTYFIFIYTRPFDRIYPKDTIKVWEGIDKGYLRAMVDSGLGAVNSDNPFIVENHEVKEKWFCMYKDKSEFTKELTDSSDKSTKCWKCDTVKDDIRLRGVRIDPYSTKSSLFDSRHMDIGSGTASLCYDCSMDIVKDITESRDVELDQSQLVAYGI